MNYTAKQISEITGYTEAFELLTFKEGQHYGALLGNLSFLPTTKRQAEMQIKAVKRGCDNLLMCGRHMALEEFLNSQGVEGAYCLTKSRTMRRLTNLDGYVSALKSKFDLK